MKLITDLIEKNIICHSGGMLYECPDGEIFFSDYEADTHCEMKKLDKDEVTEELDDNYFIVNEHNNKSGWGFNGTLYSSSEIIEMYNSNNEKLFDTTRIKSCKETADELYKKLHETPVITTCEDFDNRIEIIYIETVEKETEQFWFKD